MKILCYCDFYCATGFAKVAENILYRLAEKMPKSWHFDVIGCNYYGERTEVNDSITLFSCMEMAMNKNDIHGRDSMLRCIREGEYDYLYIIHDLSVIAPLYPHLKMLKSECHKRGNAIKYVFYFPIDSPPHHWHINAPDPLMPGGSAGLNIFDELITYTMYGKNMVLDIIKKISLTAHRQMKEKIKVIPHGTDSKSFYPLPQDEDLKRFRKDYFKIDQDTILIGQVNRNSCRKDFPTSLMAYKKCLDALKITHPDIKVRYYMHTAPLDEYGFNLFSICGALGIDPGTILLPDGAFNANQGIDVGLLNRIYNCFDLFYTTTTAEGWGLSILEAMACNVPVVAPVHTSIGEITLDGRYLYGVLREVTPSFFIEDGEYVRYRCDVDDTATILNECIVDLTDPTLDAITYRNHLKETSRKHAVSYNWDDIAERWASLFRQSSLKVSSGLRIIK